MKIAFDYYEDGYDGEIEYCNMCDSILFIDDVFETYHHVPGLGNVCDNCNNNLEKDIANE